MHNTARSVHSNFLRKKDTASQSGSLAKLRKSKSGGGYHLKEKESITPHKKDSFACAKKSDRVFSDVTTSDPNITTRATATTSLYIFFKGHYRS